MFLSLSLMEGVTSIEDSETVLRPPKIGAAFPFSTSFYRSAMAHRVIEDTKQEQCLFDSSDQYHLVPVKKQDIFDG